MSQKSVIMQKNLFTRIIRKGCQIVWKIIAHSSVTFPHSLVFFFFLILLLSYSFPFVTIFISSEETFKIFTINRSKMKREYASKSGTQMSELCLSCVDVDIYQKGRDKEYLHEREKTEGTR